MGNAKKTRGTRKKRFKKRAYSTKLLKPASSMPFASKKTATLTYADSYGIQFANSDVASEWLFRVNSPWDPDTSVGGHQPLGYDQYAALYKNYLVTGFGFDVTFLNPSQNGIGCGIRCENAGYAIPGKYYSAIAELRGQKISFIDLSKRIARFKGFIKPWDIQGITEKEYRDAVEQTGALVTANPNTELYLSMFAFGTNLTAGSVTVAVRVYYSIEFYNPVTLAQSS